MNLETGSLLNNRYRILQVLGQGGMGSVYRAMDENLDIEVAVKDNLFTTEEYARQFRREATILATLRHPTLPRVTDHFIIEGKGQYLVMDYIEGEDLRQRMERQGPLPEIEVVIIGAAICDALVYLSSRKPVVIHRDVKPGNVKISPQGQIFLVDFGLAKTMQGSQATTTGARAMTPGFSPPEQYGTARTDSRTDIFSLGATLYAALTGVTPEDSLARAMNQAELTPIRVHSPGVTKKVAAAVEKALALQPEDRFQTPELLKQALIGARQDTRKRVVDYFISPPPERADPAPSTDSASASAGKPASKPKSDSKPEASSKPNGRSAEKPNDDDDSEFIRVRRPIANSKKKPPNRVGCLFLSILVLIAVSFGAYSYRVNPAFAYRVFAQVLPNLSLPAIPSTSTLHIGFPTNQPAPTLTAAPPTLMTTNTAPVIPTVAVTLPILIPSATLAPFRPTQTPITLPTPVGGGTGQIAFASNANGMPQIFLINSDGASRQQITDIPEGACQPDFSPDGQRIVFTSPCESNSDYYPGSSLYIINLDGSGLLPLPTMVGGDFDPSWSPDGKQIAFTSLRNNKHPQIYILNLEDSNVQVLSQKFAVDTQPAWSPDGKKIAYVEERNTRQDVWVMDSNGENAVQFTRTLGHLDSLPSWSSDGKQILITQYVAPGGVPRVVISPFPNDDDVEYELGKEKRPMRDAVMSPDGYWIAFEGWEIGGKHNIFLITSTGISVYQVTKDPILAFDPVWRPVSIP